MPCVTSKENPACARLVSSHPLCAPNVRVTRAEHYLTIQEWSGGLHSHRVKAGLHLFLLWVFITCTSRTGQEVLLLLLVYLSTYSISRFYKKYKCFYKKADIKQKAKALTKVKAFNLLLLVFAVVVNFAEKLILEEIRNAVKLLIVVDGYEELFTVFVLNQL